jgi:hypothetical protein
MARFDFDDLLKKDKAELDKIKTALEIYQSEDKYAFEKNKFKAENIRFFTIAILTAVISLGSSYLIESFRQKNTSKENIKKEFTDLKKSYLTEKDKNKQNELACALADFDNPVKDISIENALKDQTQIIANTDTSSAVVKEALVKLDNYDKELQKLTQQQKSGSAADQSKIAQQINEVNNNINKVAGNVPSIKIALQSTENIEQNVKQIETANNIIIKQQTSTENNSTKSSVVWFKEGYFLQFGEYRVLLQYLDKNLGIQVEICKTSESSICQVPLRSKTWVRFGSPLQFSDNGKSYILNLEAIDHAGKNPFKLAAYVTFETLNQAR